METKIGIRILLATARTCIEIGKLVEHESTKKMYRLQAMECLDLAMKELNKLMVIETELTAYMRKAA